MIVSKFWPVGTLILLLHLCVSIYCFIVTLSIFISIFMLLMVFWIFFCLFKESFPPPHPPPYSGDDIKSENLGQLSHI